MTHQQNLENCHPDSTHEQRKAPPNQDNGRLDISPDCEGWRETMLRKARSILDALKQKSQR